ncbi:MAG: hypothetical protein IJX55_08090 [Clostridia bacterium]|nr:hypothetical protein [Clostridia bacterium]
MGFGIMFFGCILLAETAGTELAGFLLMYFGMRVACEHCDCFVLPKKLCYAGMALSAVKLAMQIAGFFEITLMNATAEGFFASVYTAFMVFFYAAFFVGIAKIADETGLPSITSMAYSNIVLSSLLMVLSRVCYALVSFAPAELLGEHKAQVLGTAMLLPIVVMVLSAVLVFRCYMRICLEGDEDMEQKKNSFKSPVEFYEKDRFKRQNTQSKNIHHKKKK